MVVPGDDGDNDGDDDGDKEGDDCGGDGGHAVVVVLVQI
jgi:hypothetical protein